MSFLEKDYKMPVSSNYMKFVEGKNKFRVLSDAITGWEYWNTEKKPIRSQEPFEEMPEDIQLDKEGKAHINHFWAFVVWNYEAKKIQILELTQKGITKTIEGLVKNLKWGNPKDYDITITPSGSGFDTEYSVVPNPNEEINTVIAMQYERMSIDPDALYSGGDPFMQKK